MTTTMGRTSGRSNKRAAQLHTQNAMFMAQMTKEFEEVKEHVRELRAVTERRMKRIEQGHKMLLDWIGMQFNCYVPKELALMNLKLMGLPTKEEAFDMAAEKNKFGAPINRSREDDTKLYNFKNVFKFFFLANTKQFIDEENNYENSTSMPSGMAKIQAELKAKSIRKLNGTSAFYFDFSTIDKLNREVEEIHKKAKEGNRG